jgi:class 3 adenylate cyclase
MDVHHNMRLGREELARLHANDLEVQKEHGVKYLKCWYHDEVGNMYCLVKAPSKEACEAVHSEGHGLVADKIVEVNPDVIEAFLGGGTEAPSGYVVLEDGRLDGGFRTILFTDIVDSTGLTHELGDAEAMALFRIHDEVVRSKLSSHGGFEVKHTGDGIMASFVSAAATIECAIEILRAFAAHNKRTPQRPILVRVGINAGEPVGENDDLFGAAVQLARRVCDRGRPEQILVPAVIRDLCVGKGFRFNDQGAIELKGIPEPTRVYEVEWV